MSEPDLLRHDIEAILREEVRRAIAWEGGSYTVNERALERAADKLERLVRQRERRTYTGEGLEALRDTLGDAEGYARSRSLSAEQRARIRARCDKARALLYAD